MYIAVHSTPAWSPRPVRPIRIHRILPREILAGGRVEWRPFSDGALLR